MLRGFPAGLDFLAETYGVGGRKKDKAVVAGVEVGAGHVVGGSAHLGSGRAPVPTERIRETALHAPLAVAPARDSHIGGSRAGAGTALDTAVVN